MHVTIHFEAQLRDLVAQNPLTVSCADSASVQDALRAIDRAIDVRTRVFDDDGRLRSSLLVFLNDQPVPADAAASTAVADGDRLLLFPPISGG